MVTHAAARTAREAAATHAAEPHMASSMADETSTQAAEQAAAMQAWIEARMCLTMASSLLLQRQAIEGTRTPQRSVRSLRVTLLSALGRTSP